ncbi:hypothetical protein TNIN_46731 [Trichonephila inaurata madagascariensis]|uniref:Uncharacterized protein n=1 Tax=Trichonephila inaurata madagascariensis TaxID=2747483 RepID=A0A8X6XIY9_9ARAC|nr:hypothetical protein TNIN_46731 [Trichonephila inaurata madagascariensis]
MNNFCKSLFPKPRVIVETESVCSKIGWIVTQNSCPKCPTEGVVLGKSSLGKEGAVADPCVRRNRWEFSHKPPVPTTKINCLSPRLLRVTSQTMDLEKWNVLGPRRPDKSAWKAPG